MLQKVFEAKTMLILKIIKMTHFSYCSTMAILALIILFGGL